jgi:glycosyltransferase involved in cell wall biosynthesis
MPTILHLVHDFYDHSMSRLTLQIIQQLHPQGYDFHVGAVTDYDMISEKFREAGATTIEFFKMGKLQDVVRDYLTDHNIPLLHSHSPRTAVTAGLALRGMSGVAHVHTRHLLTNPGSRRFGIAYTAIDRASLFIPDLVIPVSKTMGEQINQIPLLSASKIHPIQNGVNTERFYVPEARAACRAELGLADDEIALIFTGRFDVMKRLDLLIEAFARARQRHPRIRLILVGKDGLIDALKAQAEALGAADALIWTGFRSDIPRLLAAADIYVQSSSNEGLSLSILEAMAAEKTIVSTDVGAAREVLEHGKTALIIPPLDANALTSAILHVLDDRVLAARLATSARQAVTACFSIERMAEEYRLVYDRYIGKK